MHFSIKLTCAPGMMTSNTMQPMLNAGMTEKEAYDVVMVNAMFAFMNRLADGTGVTLTEARTSLAEELLGKRVVEQHLAWGARTEP